MMKWGRKKSSSPSRSSSASSIFHLSWFSKTKQTGRNSTCEPEKGERDAGCKGVQMPVSGKNGRFYGGEGVSGWRLSFGEDNCEVERSGEGLKPVWYDSGNKNQELNFPSCRRRRTDDMAEREEALKFNRMLSDIRKLRELPYCEGAKGRGNIEFEGLGRKDEKERKLRNSVGGDTGEKKLDFGNRSDKEEVNLVLQEKGIFKLKPVKLTESTKGINHRRGAFPSNYNFKTIEEDYMLEALKLDEENKVNSGWKKFKEMKLKELTAKTENRRKSVYISKEPLRKTTKQSSKFGVYSPRTAYKVECKIKAIERMKRAKKKTDKKSREKTSEGRTAFDSFAVVKNSFDPQSDFRNSMIEMITAKGMKKPEELEELLACYLTLNADQYHGTIVKVFRQVWFELIQNHRAPATEN